MEAPIRHGIARLTKAAAAALLIAACFLGSAAAAETGSATGPAAGAAARGDHPGQASQPKKGHGHGVRGGSSGPIGGSTAGPSAALSRQPIVENGAWRNYVLDSPTPVVYPVATEVVNASPSSSIDAPDGIEVPGGAVSSFTSTGPDQAYEVVDLGRLRGGTVEISVTANSGVPIRLAYSESRRFLAPGGDVAYPSQGHSDDPSARFDDLPPAPGVYRLRGIRGSERYVLIQLGGAGSAQIDYLSVTINHLRPSVDTYAGHFLSSDDLLNRIWYAGAYTLNLDTYGNPNRGNRFAVTDGAKRDRLVWIGDLGIEGLSGLYAVRQMPIYLRRSLQMFTCQQYRSGFIPQVSEVDVNCPRVGAPNGPPPSARDICTCVVRFRLPAYTAWFLVGVGEYYEMTGDRRVKRWLPVIERAIGYFRSGLGRGGLFATRDHEFNWHPPDVAVGRDADTNAVWARALDAAATLERQLGSRALAHSYARMAKRLERNIRRAFFDPAVGALRLNTADSTGNHTQDANVQGVLSGALRGGAANSALNFLGSSLSTPFGTATGELNNDPFMGRYISPFESGWEAIARFRYFQTEQALDLIRREWGQMITHDPTGTVWEKMTTDGGIAPYQSANPDGSPIVETDKSGITSLAHGWGSGPTAALSAYVLGMRPIEPGWKKWLVEPQVGDLQFAQGSVGTPGGPLEVRWQRSPDVPAFQITVKGPRRRSGIVAVPLLGGSRTIARDGRVVWASGHPVGGTIARRGGDYVFFSEPRSGQHTYAWSG